MFFEGKGIGHQVRNMVHSKKCKALHPQEKGKLVIVSAPSGAGKTTIMRHLISCSFGLKFSVSATSRNPRLGEVNGRDYFFISAEEFKEKINNREFLEWQEVYPGTFYGTLKSQVEPFIANGNPIIFDVDVVGGLNIKKMFGSEALAIFVQPPSIEVLKNRLINRSSEPSEKINQRIEKAVYEMDFAKQFDVIIINDVLELAFKEAEKIVREFLK
jgi:guanylate kinase